MISSKLMLPRPGLRKSQPRRGSPKFKWLAKIPVLPFNFVIDFSAFLAGLVIPFWGVVGSIIGLATTMLVNPLLYHFGVLSSWRPDMGFIDTSFVNTLDFYMSFGIGLTLAVTFSQFFVFLASTIRARFSEPKARALTQRLIALVGVAISPKRFLHATRAPAGHQRRVAPVCSEILGLRLFQLSTTLPDCPLFMASNPFSNSV